MINFLTISSFLVIHVSCNYPKTLPFPSLDFSSFQLISQNKSLTSYQIKGLFVLIDQNKDGLIHLTEWNSFYELFITKYESDCDPDSSYTLDLDKEQSCITTPESFSFLKELMDGEGYISQLNAILIGNSSSFFNFYHYVSLRRYAFAFKTCETQKYLQNIRNFSCACEFLLDFSELSLIDMNHLFSLLSLFSNYIESSKIRTITFLQLISIVEAYNMFLDLQYNNDRNKVGLGDVKEGIEEGFGDSLILIEKLFKKDFQEGFLFDFKSYFLWKKALESLGGKLEVKLSDFKLALERGTPKEIYEYLTKCQRKIVKSVIYNIINFKKIAI